MSSLKFIHRVSKGSRFNQIYVPKRIESDFEVGDMVEVRLLKKKIELYSSPNLPRISKFKEKLIRDIFSFLSGYGEIRQIFIFGSFLTKHIDYNDIDILILIEKDNQKFEKKIYNELIEEFNLKFHVICIEKDKLRELLKISPLIRNIIYFSISNKKIEDLPEIEINKNSIKFILMFPEDVLDIDVNSRMLYDALKRVFLIYNFIKKLDISSYEIDKKMINLIGMDLYESIRRDAIITKEKKEIIKNIIKKKIKFINNLLKNEQTKQNN
ncbi:nucleotidyltransferase domain-containing protein [Candidatus Pacearchaeota archaeon]|nr:nucleotidyltransferase domain-containing protein [Candidatus Pacearchaeota archaeon]